MADVFTVLAKDHEEVKGMLAELEKGPAKAAGASQDQLARRKKMTEELIIEESKHEALEEMYFWPAVREHRPAGDTLADEATGQEQEAKEVLARLDKLQAGAAVWAVARPLVLGVRVSAWSRHGRRISSRRPACSSSSATVRSVTAGRSSRQPSRSKARMKSPALVFPRGIAAAAVTRCGGQAPGHPVGYGCGAVLPRRR